MNRPQFTHASGAVLGTRVPALERISQAASFMEPGARPEAASFEWSPQFSKFSFSLSGNRLRQGSCVPAGVPSSLTK